MEPMLTNSPLVKPPVIIAEDIRRTEDGNHKMNHVKVLALVLLASLVIMLIGITDHAIDRYNGYGVAVVGQSAL